MRLKTPNSLALIMAAAMGMYAVAFWVFVTIDPDVARSRFDALVADQADGRAIGHGEQILALRSDRDADDLFDLRLILAKAQADHGDKTRAIELYREILALPQARNLTIYEKSEIRNQIARLSIATKDYAAAADIYASFLTASGDLAALSDIVSDPGQFENVAIEHVYVHYVQNARDAFAAALPSVQAEEILIGSELDRLAAAEKMAILGGYYAALPDSDYAAAGLLLAAYRTRTAILGASDADTLHTVLLLGPVLSRIGQVDVAQEIYLSTLHAQEQALGSNNPDLSLYMRLLADTYKTQGRYTEAEALNRHIHDLFRDAFGARRYLSNRQRDRRMDINRPVSVDFPLENDFVPTDLVSAEAFDIPLSKTPGIEEMTFRLGAELAEEEEESLPKMLSQLLTFCSAQSGEKLSLRSGYRSFQTQVDLFRAIGHKGTVTRPGTSEHQLGLAVDIDVDRRFMRSTDRAYQCFDQHAWRYGFILTYPKGNTYLTAEDTYEPWHWRYVGRQTALLYREAGPINRPQEFLANLPCYQERAEQGLWAVAGERDMCLEPAPSREQVTAAADAAARGSR